MRAAKMSSIIIHHAIDKHPYPASHALPLQALALQRSSVSAAAPHRQEKGRHRAEVP
jgi:hypothetical protein